MRLDKQKPIHRNIFRFFLMFLFACLLFTLFFFINKNLSLIKITKKESVPSFDISKSGSDIYITNFVQDINNSVNSSSTKANIYLFLYSYIDNGGNIYEIFNRTETIKELAFLQEAENIYPEVFLKIKNKELPHYYSDEGMYAFLAYLEVVDSHNYADLTTESALAQQYAKMAYFKKMILEDRKNGESLNYPKYSQEGITADIKKSEYFLNKADTLVSSTLNVGQIDKNENASEVIAGLVQYASSLRYLEAIKLKFVTNKSSSEVFDFALKQTIVNNKGYYLFVTFSNASTLLLVKDFNKNELRYALFPFFDIKNVDQIGGLVKNILNARFNRRATRFGDLDTYSYKNVKLLADNCPEFKLWLTKNGWAEEDFK